MKQLFTAALLMLSFAAQAQISFDIDTVYGREKASEFEVIAYAKFNNPDVVDGKFVWLRTTNALPGTWTSAVCDVEACRSETTDSANFEFAQGTAKGDFSFHFYPKGNKGNAYMVVKVYAESDKNNSATIVAYSEAWGLNVKTFYNTPYVCFPNPAGNVLMVNGLGQSEVATTITTVTGETVASASLSELSNSMDLSTLSAGTYIVSFNDGNHVYRQTLVKN